ncbi:glycosyltransferase family 4 protein [Polluticoccus soli]|uniref:glycosyltransferase family 4 protein n=1 Tax=Polluticoccus soli TaxID=3034150 RepID=UPI0023E25286|nr:glycosyltransferase family 4 protein [Flavipsychrobacter sp. JY13-12]
MRVLLLSNNYPRRGNESNGIFIHQQAKALQQLGVECHVLQLYNWYPGLGLHKLNANWQLGHTQRQQLFTEYEGIHVHHVPVFLYMPDRIFRNDYEMRAAAAVASYVKKNKQLRKSDWLYAHFLTDSGYVAALAASKMNIRTAAIARGDDIHAWPEKSPALANRLKYVFHKADILMANSARLASDARRWMESGRERELKVVYNGIDHEKFRPAVNAEEKRAYVQSFGLDPNYKYILCVATPVALKGWLELFNAIGNLSEDLTGWKLLIVAPPYTHPDAIDLRLMSVEQGIGDKTVFMGHMDSEKLAKLYRASDVFVLPSYNEGMANSLLEAMASGIACIATEVGGHAEVIENGKDGVLVSPRNTTELQNAISTVCSDTALLQQYGANARKRALQLGSYAENAKRLYDLFESYPNGK